MAKQKSTLKRGTRILNSILTLVFSLISLAYAHDAFTHAFHHHNNNNTII